MTEHKASGAVFIWQRMCHILKSNNGHPPRIDIATARGTSRNPTPSLHAMSVEWARFPMHRRDGHFGINLVLVFTPSNGCCQMCVPPVQRQSPTHCNGCRTSLQTAVHLDGYVAPLLVGPITYTPGEEPSLPICCRVGLFCSSWAAADSPELV